MSNKDVKCNVPVWVFVDKALIFCLDFPHAGDYIILKSNARLAKQPE